MAHQMTDTDGFFTVREPAWHGLGVVLDNYPTREQAQKIAHNWEPVSEPIYRKIQTITPDGDLTETFEEIEDSELRVRSDNAASLGVSSKTRESVRNSEMWDIAEVLQDGGTDVMFETAGSLGGGRKVWILIRLKDPLIVKGDKHGATIPYYALQNGHSADGGSFRGQATMTRIVCANTAQIADLDAQSRGTEFVFRHTKNVRERIEEAKLALAGWRAGIDQWQLLVEALINTRISDEQAWRFVGEFIPMPPERTVSDRVVQNVEKSRGQLQAILDGQTCEGISRNAYGLVQASVEYLNHARRANSQESRFKRSFLDRNDIVTHAVELAQEVAVS